MTNSEIWTEFKEQHQGLGRTVLRELDHVRKNLNYNPRPSDLTDEKALQFSEKLTACKNFHAYNELILRDIVGAMAFIKIADGVDESFMEEGFENAAKEKSLRLIAEVVHVAVMKDKLGL